MGSYILPALGGFVLGTGVAYLNYNISKKVLEKNSVAGIMGVNLARLAIDMAVLLAVFILCRRTQLPLGVSLISTALGETLCGILFLSRLAKQAKQDGNNGGE